MTCPSCGAAVQTGDYFCLSCGHPLHAADLTQTLTAPAAPTYGDGPPTYDDTAPTYGDSAPTYGDSPVAQPSPYTTQTAPPPPSYVDQTPPAYAPSPAPAQRQGGQNTWASGSSVPASNPYNNQRNTVTPGTMVNGRPVRSGGGGLLQGLGAGVVALFVLLGKFGAVLLVLLGKFGAALAGLGIFKFLFYIWAFRLLFHGLGGALMVLIVLLIVGAIWRSRTA